MARTRVSFVCRSCGGVQPRWMGKCPDCGAWDALEEQRVSASVARDPQKGLAEGWAGPVGGDAGGEAVAALVEAPVAQPIRDVGESGPGALRVPSRIGELDRVLGGGLVRGSAVLVGGDPGIGKSTLLLQAAGRLSEAGVRVLYVASEESAQQVRMRAERLGILREGAEPESLYVLPDTNVARIAEQARKVRPEVMIIDSIQMIYRADLPASPGSITQLRRCCTELVYLAKASGMAVVMVGHVTKDGALAGPRLLEHLVDAVLYFEGDRYHAHRVVRAVKNRFGATLEIGLFEMTGVGLREAPDGASVVAGAGDAPRPGSVVCPVVSGSRCVLVEVQALTATGFLGAAKRKASGVDPNRLAVLIAVLERYAGVRLADQDVFASAVGGVRVVEPAADLALALAIVGSHYKKALPAGTAAVGEVGLGGEVRPVAQVEQRLREAARLGYTRVLTPSRIEPVRGLKIELVKVGGIEKAMQELG